MYLIFDKINQHISTQAMTDRSSHGKASTYMIMWPAHFFPWNCKCALKAG
jgi:hypothetical protein